MVDKKLNKVLHGKQTLLNIESRLFKKNKDWKREVEDNVTPDYNSYDDEEWETDEVPFIERR